MKNNYAYNIKVCPKITKTSQLINGGWWIII
jgi:hypothetical protein